MAGVKGKSGGTRVGAGRKPKEPAIASGFDPLDFLEGVMRGELDATALQVRAAVAAAQYRHAKKGDAVKKDHAAEATKRAIGGKYAPKAPPKLVVNNR